MVVSGGVAAGFVTDVDVSWAAVFEVNGGGIE